MWWSHLAFITQPWHRLRHKIFLLKKKKKKETSFIVNDFFFLLAKHVLCQKHYKKKRKRKKSLFSYTQVTLTATSSQIAQMFICHSVSTLLLQQQHYPHPPHLPLPMLIDTLLYSVANDVKWEMNED